MYIATYTLYTSRPTVNSLKINIVFSLTLLHAYKRRQRKVFDYIRTPSTTFKRGDGTGWYQKSSVDGFL